MIVVHHLNNSRSQRILWLLEELGLPYEIKAYSRDAVTNLAPPELKTVHPLGKSPVISDGEKVISESGAITDYIIRKHGGGRLAPAPGSDAHEEYLQWLHFAEGSAMTPFLLALYTARLGEAAAPLTPRIQEQIGAHVAYFAGALGENDWLVGNELSGADIMMSFIAEIAVAQGLGTHFPNLAAYVQRLQARPAWVTAAGKTEAYSFDKR
ncbi:glutathione S-transferase [Polymorphobacter glacialis]|uniref:glutathione transferase n=1 Tax=Sandarakinorhabdus glacialis TaxID=1614636 RepID=A0A916ZZK6_9SPHN|nr:glutathione S-transferase family protein [Polymorphobacter glacialis]GGE20421.1 glutathione S-transferase [Polymorphobacter glacialis]